MAAIDDLDDDARETIPVERSDDAATIPSPPPWLGGDGARLDVPSIPRPAPVPDLDGLL